MELVSSNNVNYLITNSNKFKTSRITLMYTLDIAKCSIEDFIILQDLVLFSTKQYDSVAAFNHQLMDLYDLKVGTNLQQKGRVLILEFNINKINDAYLPTNIVDDVVALVDEFVNQININEAYLEVVKDKAILNAKAVYDEKLKYAFKRVQDLINQEELIIANLDGDIDKLQAVSVNSLNKCVELLKSDTNLTILIDGDDGKALYEGISKLNFVSKQPINNFLHQFERSSDEQFYCEHQNLSQSKFVFGVKLDVSQEDLRAFQIFNAIYGGYPFSRLFTNIREKQSLAYFVSSVYNFESNVMYIFGGIDNGAGDDNAAIDHIEQALRDELDSIASGNVHETEMEQAKAMMVNTLKTILDDQKGYQDLLFNLMLLNKDLDLAQVVSEIENVTIKQVVAIAANINFNIKFLLRGDK